MADRDVTVVEMTKTGRGAFIQIPNKVSSSILLLHQVSNLILAEKKIIKIKYIYFFFSKLLFILKNNIMLSILNRLIINKYNTFKIIKIYVFINGLFINNKNLIL